MHHTHRRIEFYYIFYLHTHTQTDRRIEGGWYIHIYGRDDWKDMAVDMDVAAGRYGQP